MKERSEFQEKCIADFAGVLSAWNLAADGTNLLINDEPKTIADKLKELGRIAGKGTIVDFSNKNFDYFETAYCIDNCIYIAWFEGRDFWNRGAKDSVFLKCIPAKMLVYSVPAKPHLNFVYIKTKPCQEPGSGEKETLQKIYTSEDCNAEPFAVPDGIDSYVITVLTKPVPVLLHPKGSGYTRYEYKDMVISQLEELC